MLTRADILKIEDDVNELGCRFEQIAIMVAILLRTIDERPDNIDALANATRYLAEAGQFRASGLAKLLLAAGCAQEVSA